MPIDFLPLKLQVQILLSYAPPHKQQFTTL
ncbi:hypothetical protein EMIT0324P_220005 [Pseudomonas chlororaphis]